MATKQRGFTLVELNLSVAFVAILILGIAMTTVQVTRMYQKGVTVKTVNQVGRDITEQLRRDFAAASPSAVNLDSAGSGRVCLGNVSYLFNDAVNLNDEDDSNNIKWSDGIESVVLVRVEDPSGTYCQRESPGGLGAPFIKQHIESGDEAGANELLAADTVPLAIHQFDAMTSLSNASGGIRQSIYQLAVTLGTNEVETVDNTARTCLPPTESSANFDNCFVSKFETVVRAGEISR